MQRLVLHVGVGKCASSTLQSYLSNFPILSTDRPIGGVVRYVAANKLGTILHGSNLTQALTGNPYGYLSSADNVLSDKAAFLAAMAGIASVCGPDDTVVLSCENWSILGFVTPQVEDIINSSPVPVDVFMLTRPPVDWVNAAWWQWGAWSEKNASDSLNSLEKINFLKSLDQWRKIGKVERVAVHDVSQGPLETFLSFVGASELAPVWGKRLNAASDFDVLRHLIRNKDHYSRTIHNPATEFRLNALILGSRVHLPFIVSRPMAREMIARDRADNEALITLMQQRGALLSDDVKRRYLEAMPYDHLPDALDVDDGIQADYSDTFVGKLIDTILDLDRRVALSEGFLSAYEVFEPKRYLELNEDVRDAGMNAYEHYLRFGFQEGRRIG